MRATGGIGIVLSSGAVEAGEMRGTEDMINLCVATSHRPHRPTESLTASVGVL